MALITTTKGELEETLLVKKTGSGDNENETFQFVEYWLEGECVHRSVDMKLKKGVDFGAELQNFI